MVLRKIEHRIFNKNGKLISIGTSSLPLLNGWKIWFIFMIALMFIIGVLSLIAVGIGIVFLKNNFTIQTGWKVALIILIALGIMLAYAMINFLVSELKDNIGTF